MKLLVINGNGYSIFAPGSSCLSRASWRRPSQDHLEYLYFDEQELDENTAAELERIWRMDANGDYIWSELEDNA